MTSLFGRERQEQNKMQEQKTYTIFDGSEEMFTPKTETNANIRAILSIPTQAAFKSDEERLYYAQEGDIPPAKFDADGTPHYSLANIYMQGSYWPALAQALFYGCPDIVSVKKGVVKVVNKELYDSLNRAEVRKAFNFFLGSFGATPYEVRSLLNVWDNAQIRQILQKVKEITDPDAIMNTPSGAGGSES